MSDIKRAMNPTAEESIQYLKSMIFPQDMSISTLMSMSVNKLAIEALQEKSERENPKPLTAEQLKERVGKPVWCSRNKLYGVLGTKNGRLVIGFYYGWEWLEDLISKEIYDYEPKDK